MNTSAVHYSSEPSWSRRNSIESVLSIQGKETDIVNDSSDTEAGSDDGQDLEYEPCTDPENKGLFSDSSGESDDETIIATKVIKVIVPDEADLEFADTELTEDSTELSDSEIERGDYWRCAQCGSGNNTPKYRYCQKCFKVRKNCFPPRPKRKHKRQNEKADSRPLSQDSCLDTDKDPVSPLSQTESQDKLRVCSQDSGFDSQNLSEPSSSVSSHSLGVKLKRRADSIDRKAKRFKTDQSSDSNTDDEAVTPPVKSVSDPALTVENIITRQVLTDTAKEIDNENNLCIICLTEPKSGVFVHGRVAHICCCYRCAVKVWSKAKRCPVCNCKVSNVLRAVVM